MAEKHWRKFLPKMVAELEAKGLLHKMLLEAEERTERRTGRSTERRTQPRTERGQRGSVPLNRALSKLGLLSRAQWPVAPDQRHAVRELDH